MLVSAHPEPQSFHAALHAAVEELQAQGYAVQVSDLYAICLKVALDREDFRTVHDAERFNVSDARLRSEKKPLTAEKMRKVLESLKEFDANGIYSYGFYAQATGRPRA